MERLQSGGKKQAVQETGQNETSQNDATTSSFVFVSIPAGILWVAWWAEVWRGVGVVWCGVVW